MLLFRHNSGALILLLLSALILSIGYVTILGSADVPVDMVWDIIQHKLLLSDQTITWSRGKEAIIWQIRIPRILLATFVGAGLALVGTCLQAVTRNSMADPYLFGASAGASLGAVLVLLHLGLFLGPFSLPVAAFLGALLSMLLVLFVAQQGQGLSQQQLVLSGVAVHFILMSITNYLIFAGEQKAAVSAMFWMMGGLGAAQWSQLVFPFSALLFALIVMLSWSKILNAIMAGDETATTLGINVNRTRILVFLVCALVTGVMVAFSGAIGFVGLMVPHIVRLLVGADNRKVLPISALLGALLLVWADALARVIIAPQDLPVGIVTAILGGSFFVFLMAKK
ncbi:MAG: iron ABC transporter permease [Psychromonas sp.]|nr:iron ABC transporter permease [Alteromonadales bacterium]MCP5079026.1 iron ABC transporter permease [Psychromonas sp.]